MRDARLHRSQFPPKLPLIVRDGAWIDMALRNTRKIDTMQVNPIRQNPESMKYKVTALKSSEETSHPSRATTCICNALR